MAEPPTLDAPTEQDRASDKPPAAPLPLDPMASPSLPDAQPEQTPAAPLTPDSMAGPTFPDAQPVQAPASEKPPAAPLTPEPEDAAEVELEEEEEEYVSDPDDAPLPAMRRREASDDEGSEEGRRLPRARIGPDHDDDGQGAPEVYEDEVYEEDDDEYYDDLGEDEVGEGFEDEYEGRALLPMDTASGLGEENQKVGEEGAGVAGEGEGEGEEKKEHEPFAVPTFGAFYMHDDRFQEEGRGGGRRRGRMFGGRKLWDAKDDQAWVHDRFEEMNLQEERFEDKRMSRGRFRGRGVGGRTRSVARGFSRGGKYQSYHEDGNNQNRPQKVVRGRGPRRYEAVARSNREEVGFQRKQPARSRQPASNAAAVRQSSQISNAQSEAVLPKRNVVNSSLNSASPPFYPSGSSNQDFSVPSHRMDIQVGGSNKVHPSSMKMDDNFKLQTGQGVRGRAAMDYSGRERLHAGSHVRQSPARTAGTSMNSLGFAAASINVGQSPIVRGQAGNSSTGTPSNNQSTSSLHQTSRISTQQQNHTSVLPQKSGQAPNQSAMRIPTQQLSHRTGNSSPTAQHMRSTESGENGSYPNINKSKTTSPVVGKSNSQETGRGSFMYGGAQVLGAAGAFGLTQGEQNFPGTPALLPVMQFGSQHSGGPGVPTVGMALPGYVAQQQLGMANNEMTWLPVLAGAAGAFGGSYQPYITLDPSFYSRSSGQTSSSVPSREPSASKGTKSPPRNDIVNDELDLRQNKPRRYSEMNFSQ